MVLLALLYSTIRSHTFINKTVEVALQRLSEDLNTEVSVEKVEIGWWKNVTLHNVMIRDLNHDTLISVHKLYAKISQISTNKHLIQLSQLDLDRANVHFEKPKGQDTFNFNFFFRYFTPKKKPTKPIIWTIKANETRLFNSVFRYRNEAYPAPKDRRFDENFMEYRSINANISNLQIIGDSLHFKINELNTVERSGLQVDQLSCLTIISRHTISLEELNLKTPHSELKDQFTMTYSSYADMSNFIKLVDLKTKLKNSKISLQDIAYFYEPLWGRRDQFIVSGNSSGAIKNLDVNDLNITYGKQTKLIGKIDFTGLPDINNTLIDANISNLLTNSADLGQLLSAPEALQEVKALGKVKFQGNLVGFVHDFVSRGTWTSDLGMAKTDLKFSYTNKQSILNANYKGSIETKGFQLGSLLPSSGLGQVAGTIELDGEGLDLNTINTEFSTNLNLLEIDNRKLQGITASGNLIKQKFNGKAQIKDQNALLNFDGEIDLTQSQPKFVFTGDIEKLNLSYFGLDTGQSVLSGKLTSNLEGNQIDNFVGLISLDKGILRKNNRNFSLSSFKLIFEKAEGHRRLNLQSNFADADLTGDFRLSELPKSMQQILHNLSPAYFPYTYSNSKDFFKFKINIKEPDLILAYIPKFYTFGPMQAQGSFNALQDRLQANIDIPFLGLNGVHLNQTRLEINKAPRGAMFAKVSARNINHDTTNLADELNILAEFENNNIQFLFNSSGEKLNYKAKIAATAKLTTDTILLNFSESSIKVHGRNWQINNDGMVMLSNDIFTIQKLYIQTNDQNLTLNGTVSKDPNSELQIDFSNLYPGKLLYDLNMLAEDELQGKADGWLKLSRLYQTPLIQSDFAFTNGLWHKDTIGDLDVKIVNSGKDKLIVDGTQVTSGPFKGLKAEGSILLNDVPNNYNLNLILPKSRLNILENFLKGMVSNVSGYAQSRNLELKGKFEKPILTGEILLEKTSFKLDYLGTTYAIPQANLSFSRNLIKVNPLDILDVNNNKSKIAGQIKHQYFDKWNFDIALKDIQKMQLLNTTYKDNELFFGTGYASGSGFIKGPLEGIDIYLKAKTEKGTKVTLPLENGDASTSVPFIKFKKEENAQNRTVKAAFSNINSIIIDIEATKDAIAEIVFDSKVGDVMTGSASGVLKFEVNKSADFFMYGSLKVIQGDYLFTAFNFVNKPFKIEPGGTIFWDGDPYNAKINLAAIYQQKASLSPLVDPGLYGSESEFENAKARLKTPIDVNSKILLSGLLFTPKIQFDIEFPELTSVGNSSVEVTTIKNKLENDPQELNKQFLSLLVFNRFLPVSFENIGSIASTTPGQSASEMLSAQLNNWVSDLGIGIVDNISFDLGKDTADQRELVVSAEKTLFNERLTIKGAYGNRVGSNATNVSVEYNITKDGNLKLRTNYTPFYYSTLYTNTNQQGLGGVRRGTVGVFFRREFETIKRKKKKD